MGDVMLGIILNLNTVRGFGFVRDEDGTARVFHLRDLVDRSAFVNLTVGQRVRFEGPETPRGEHAGEEELVD
jgi:cold shock CspA family protein